MPIDEEQESLFVFPCEYPIKIMGKASDLFEIEILTLIRRHVDDLQESALSIKLSENQRYMSITVTITAKSKEQLDAIYQDLTTHPLVLFAL